MRTERSQICRVVALLIVGCFRDEWAAGAQSAEPEAVAADAGEVRLVTVLPGVMIALELASFGQVLERVPGPIDTEGASVTTRYDARFIDGLPIIGHNYQDVLTLAPGVDDPEGDGKPNVHGSRDTATFYRFDRGDTTDPAMGGSGMNLNPLAIDGVEVVTAGAPAEYGRATGGFATVLTRSGGNDLEAKLVLYWRGRFLDGDGSGNHDVVNFDDDETGWHDFRAAAGLGGPILKDRLWYFVTLESLDTETPTEQIGSDLLITSRGDYGFGKVTWQVDGVHKLALQLATDPRRFEGLGLDGSTAFDSGYSIDRRALDAQLHWTAAMPGGLLLEAAVTSFESKVTEEPTSSDFEPIPVDLFPVPGALFTGVAAVYPCQNLNCDETAGERIYQVDYFTTGRVTGPWYRDIDDERERHALRVDLSWGLEEFAGTHRVKAGFEVADETLRSEQVINPILNDLTSPAGPPFSPGQVTGIQILETLQEHPASRQVDGLTTGLYLSDSWKPVSNLVLTFGVRFDDERIDAPGMTPFDPMAERRQAVILWEAVCQEYARQGLASAGSNCSPLRAYDGQPPSNVSPVLDTYLDQNMDGINDVPQEVAALDQNGDGFFFQQSPEGRQLLRDFTRPEERQVDNFEIQNSNWSPRVGVSWDPINDGMTRLYAHWGRYYDRIPLEMGLADSNGTSMSFAFTPDPVTGVIVPGRLSTSSSQPTIGQLDHDLGSPRTDELSLGFERLLGQSWSVGAGYIRRTTEELAQDVDRNHHTCLQSEDAIGIEPVALCGNMGVVDTDIFGGVGGFFNPTRPNGIEDLYIVSPFYNRIFVVDNADSSEYEAYELRIRRSLYENWQMQASYTLSKARGSAESSFSVVGDDPSTPVDENDYLEYDQRHRVKLQAVTHLPRGIILGGSVMWASGKPYSVAVASTADFDSAGNTVSRYLLPSGERNDERNEGTWRLDGRVEKVFNIGKLHASGFVLAENLLDSDDLTIYTVEPDGSGLVATREPGRRFEIGASFAF